MTPQEYHSRESWSLSSRDYWATRSSRRVILAEKQSERRQLEVIKIYEKSLRNINSLLNDVFRRYADKTGLDVSELTQVLKGGEKSQAILDIQKKMQSLGFDIKDVYRPEYLAEISRLEALKQQVYWEIQSIAPKELEALEPMYRQVIDRAYRETRADIRKTGSLNTFGTINKADIDSILNARWVGGNWSSRIWKNTEKLATEARRVIGGGLVSGYSNQRMARELRETFDVGTYRSMRLVRTEVNFVRGQAELQSYIDDGIEWYRYQAVMDSRTSHLCEEQHDEIYKVSEAQVGENYPPLHPNCRSTTVVVYADELPPKLRRLGDNKPYHRRDIEMRETEEDIQRAYEEHKREGAENPLTKLEERWGKVEIGEAGMNSWQTKLQQGGDKALNAEAEWIMNRSRFTTDEKVQRDMMIRLDEIIRDMKDEGQRQQVQMVKEYMSFPSREATPFTATVNGKRVEVALERELKDFIDNSGVKITGLPDPTIRGAYHPELNELAINPNIPDHLVDRTIKHEIGHLVDYKLEGKPQSDSKDFRRVAYNGGASISDEGWAVVQARLEGKDIMGFDDAYRLYVQKPDEVFAEGFRQYIQTPKEMKQYAPEMYEYYEGVYKKLGGEKLVSSITEKERVKTLSDYQDYGYNAVNGYLRGTDRSFDEKGLKKIQRDIEIIDDTFKTGTSKLETGTVLYRGDGAQISATLWEKLGMRSEIAEYNGKVMSSVGNDYAQALATARLDTGIEIGGEKYHNFSEYLTKKMSGEVFVDEGYLSTSTDKGVVEQNFLAGSSSLSKSGYSAVVNIKGAKEGIDMNRYGFTSLEKEVLLNRGTRLRIDKVEFKTRRRASSTTDEGYLEIDVTII